MELGDSLSARAVDAAMWAAVERYTGRIRHKGGVKADGLGQTPPVIDCSGWTALLLSTGMRAANQAAERVLFTDADMAGYTPGLTA